MIVIVCDVCGYVIAIGDDEGHLKYIGHVPMEEVERYYRIDKIIKKTCRWCKVHRDK